MYIPTNKLDLTLGSIKGSLTSNNSWIKIEFICGDVHNDFQIG